MKDVAVSKSVLSSKHPTGSLDQLKFTVCTWSSATTKNNFQLSSEARQDCS